MQITVDSIFIPVGSTIGYGIGTVDDGTVAVLFAGDHRAMAALGEAIAASEEPIIADVPEWAVLDRREL